MRPARVPRRGREMSKYESAEYQRQVSNMVRREVGHCVSSLVATLANAAHSVAGSDRDAVRDLQDLSEQAFELCRGVPDYEEAAIQEGWTGPHKDKFGATYFENKTESEQNQTWCAADWEALCRDFDIEPYESEVYEHWIVSGWLADKLEAAGERVDKDFVGLCVWGRTCTGQGIAMDRVICEIYDATMERVPT